MSELSTSDALLMTNNSGFGGNNIIWILFLFFLMCGGGWGYGGGNNSGFQNSFTRAEMSDGFTTQNIQNDLKQINNGLVNGFNSVNANVQAGIFESQKEACGLNRNIDQVRYENNNNTCKITTAIHDEGEKTRALITANQIQELRDSREAIRNELQSAQLTLANAAQTQNILGSIGRYVPYAGCGSTCGF